MKTIILGLLLTCCFVAFGQNHAPSNDKKEAQNLIIEKLKEHSYNNIFDKIKNDYVISFKDSSMMIFNYKEDSKYYTTLKVMDIDSISIEEKDYSVCLKIKLTEGKKETTFKDLKPTEISRGYYDFILNKSFLIEDMPEKVGDAFRKLTNFYN